VVVCLIQCEPERGTDNIGLFGRLIRGYAADIYVLPELFAGGFLKATTDWRRMAEPLISGPTFDAVSRHQALRSSSAVIYGFLENDHGNMYNSAAVIAGKGCVEVYRQKFPATRNGQRILPIIPGDFRAIHAGPIQHGYQWKVGLMICSDHYGAEDFFEYYSDRKSDAVILIADSPAKPWVRQFPPLCQKYKLPAIICNAAGAFGEGKGESCVIDVRGEFLARLPESPNWAVVNLPWH
jgi:predicted amidohydrolase